MLPLFSVKKTSNEDIFMWVMSAACKTIDDVKNKFPVDDDQLRAIRIFEVCKNEDPESRFAKIRKNWNPAQTVKVAMMHVVTPFKDAQEAEQWLKVAATNKRFFGAKDGSLGNIKIEINYESMYRFISQTECTIEDVNARFDIPEHNAAARRMFDVCHGEAFAEFRAELAVDKFAESVCLVAKAHANPETKFKNAIEAAQFLKISDLKVDKSRSFSNYHAETSLGAPSLKA